MNRTPAIGICAGSSIPSSCSASSASGAFPCADALRARWISVSSFSSGPASFAVAGAALTAAGAPAILAGTGAALAVAAAATGDAVALAAGRTKAIDALGAVGSGGGGAGFTR